MKQKTILITNGLHSSGVASARELSRCGYDVIGADFGRLPLNLRSRYVQRHLPVVDGSKDELVETLLEKIARYRPAALLPIGSRFVEAAILGRREIEITTSVAVPTLDSFSAVFDKGRCMRECQDLGIPHARAYTLAESRRLLEGAEPTARFVVKPDFDAGGAQGVCYPSSLEQLEQAYRATVHLHGGALIQEYIPGGVRTMKAVTLLYGAGSRLVAAFTLQKLGQLPREGGLTTLAQSSADERILNQVLPLFEKLKWVGAAEVELKFDERDGLNKVIEINPRFPGYVGFAVECGLPLSQLAVAETLGESLVREFTFPNYRVGELYCSPGLLAEAVWCDLRMGIRPDLGLEGVRRAVGPVCRGIRAWLADPGPVLGRVLGRL